VSGQRFAVATTLFSAPRCAEIRQYSADMTAVAFQIAAKTFFHAPASVHDRMDDAAI
jgi:Mlc titration factor MtfA (ptsG expression regulator)